MSSRNLGEIPHDDEATADSEALGTTGVVSAHNNQAY
jgi:hypothetical protein